jgi:hypothetical protein
MVGCKDWVMPMKKSKVKAITVEFEDRAERWQVDATFSESRNGRKGDRLGWTEYHITWITYDKPEPVVKEEEPDHRKEDAWCSVHKMNPGECFKLHNPTAYSGRLPEYTKTSTGAFARAVEKEMKEIKKSILEDFDLTDLLQGYGNGSIRSNGH